MRDTSQQKQIRPPLEVLKTPFSRGKPCCSRLLVIKANPTKTSKIIVRMTYWRALVCNPWREQATLLTALL